MDENNVNTNVDIESAESISPAYRSRFLMSKELHYDFCSVGYNLTKILFIIFFCLMTYCIGINLFSGDYDVVIWYGPAMSIVMLLMYVKRKSGTKASYERMVISEGKEVTLTYELFADKIVSHNDALKREYYYNQITRLLETKSFLLLHLKHNLFVTIEKTNLNADVDEVKAFLMDKCTFVKKKKFINCAYAKEWSLAALIALIIVSVIGTTAAIILKINS